MSFKDLGCRSSGELEWFAGRKDSSRELLEELYKLKRTLGIDLELAQNPNLPSKLLEELSKCEVEDMRCNVASNPSTPTRILEQLSKDSSYAVRHRVAGNPSTPTNILEKLAIEDTRYCSAIKENVASNPSTPIEFLEKLWKFNEGGIIKGLVTNPNTPDTLLKKIINKEKWVTGLIFHRKNISISILTELLNDPEWWVRTLAFRKLTIND
jgi:hypothetical protein